MNFYHQLYQKPIFIILTYIVYYMLKNHFYQKFQYRNESLSKIIYICVHNLSHTHIIVTKPESHSIHDSNGNLRRQIFHKFLQTKTNLFFLTQAPEKRKNIIRILPLLLLLLHPSKFRGSPDYTGAWQISAINYASKTRMAINTNPERGEEGSRNERIQEQDGSVRAPETRATTLLLLLLHPSPSAKVELIARKDV